MNIILENRPNVKRKKWQKQCKEQLWQGFGVVIPPISRSRSNSDNSGISEYMSPSKRSSQISKESLNISPARRSESHKMQKSTWTVIEQSQEESASCQSSFHQNLMFQDYS